MKDAGEEERRHVKGDIAGFLSPTNDTARLSGLGSTRDPNPLSSRQEAGGFSGHLSWAWIGRVAPPLSKKAKLDPFGPKIRHPVRRSFGKDAERSRRDPRGGPCFGSLLAPSDFWLLPLHCHPHLNLFCHRRPLEHAYEVTADMTMVSRYILILARC